MLFVINKGLDYDIMTTTRTGFAASHKGFIIPVPAGKPIVARLIGKVR
jgi:hypothetical protein